jgi:hypothetical protein
MDKMNMRTSNPGMEDSQESAAVSVASAATGPHFITSVQMENSSSMLATTMQIA